MQIHYSSETAVAVLDNISTEVNDVWVFECGQFLNWGMVEMQNIFLLIPNSEWDQSQ